MIDKQEIVDGLKELGLAKGDIVLVHSSFKSFGGVNGGAQTVIDSILDVIQVEGTLIVPTFNFDFCEGKPFDVKRTPSHMGIITELVRRNSNSRRLLHPIHSFSIIGKLSEELGSLRYKSTYGKNSLFAKLRDLGGKIMIIGLQYNQSMTFFHHIEEMEGCDYRYFKKFTGEITDDGGNTYIDWFTFFVRDLDRGETHVDPMGDILEQKGIVNIQKIGGSTVKLMKANDVYNLTAQEMKKTPYLMYKLNTGKNQN
jgi:aminoglycoside 3-N-acetyltransferase